MGAIPSYKDNETKMIFYEMISMMHKRIFHAASANLLRILGLLEVHKENRSSCVLLLVAMLVVGANGALGQESEDLSGTYYITNCNTNGVTSEIDAKWFLCPAEGSSSNTNVYYNSDENTPFLTTNHTGQVPKSVWIIQKEGDNYLIIHKEDGKYLTANGIVPGAPAANRKRVHLQAALTDDAIFSIDNNGTKTLDGNIITVYYIASTTQSSGTQVYLNPSQGNKADYGPTTGITGLIGFYDKGDDGSRWIFEDVIPRPTIQYNFEDKIEITYPADPEATIYYTLDGSRPSPTNGYEYTREIESDASSINTIKAVAVSNGETSNVTTFNIPFYIGESHKFLIQNTSNPWYDTQYNFYMMRGDDGKENGNVNTSNLFRPTMEWHFKYAGNEGETIYYYVVNNSEECLYYDKSKDDGKRIWMKALDPSDDGFKFSISANTGSPSGFCFTPYGTTRYLQKANNNNYDPLTLATGRNAASTWRFVEKSDVDMAPPFTVSDESGVTYYTIENLSGTGFYIVSPTGFSTSAAVSNATDEATVMSRNWYFEKAQDPGTTDWLTYYYIRSASTSDYLYFNGTNFEMRPSGSTPDDDYMFAWVKSAVQEQWFIVPKSKKDESLNDIYSINRNGANLNVNASRNAASSKWKFAESSLTLAPPHITYDASANKVIITCSTSGATVYYTTGRTSAEEPTSGSTRYTAGATGFALPDNVNVIRAIAVKDGNSEEGAPLTIVVHASTSSKPLPYLVQSQEQDYYYMIPSEPENGLDKLNTTSLARPSMMWCFEYAATDAATGKQLFYIRNKETNQYVYYHNTDKLSLQGSSVFSDAADKEPYQFSIDASAYGGYTIRPKTASNRWLFKNGTGEGNRYATNISAVNNNEDKGWARWAFVPVFDEKMPATTPPVTVSVGDSYTFYLIRSEQDQYYFIVPPTSPATAVTTTASPTRNTDWVFEEADHDNWLTYYYIRHAATGEYMYLVNPGDNAIGMGASPSGDAYQFALARSTTESGLYIVPKSLKYNSATTYYSLFRDGTAPLKITNRRYSGTGNGDDTFIKWIATETTFSNVPPTITYDAEADGYVITTAAVGSKAYYNINAAPTVSDDHLYSTPILMSALNEGDVIRAIAASSGDAETASGETQLTIQKVAMPVIKADNLVGTVVITCPTWDATIYYATVTSDDATLPDDFKSTWTVYTEPLTDISGVSVKAVAVRGGFITSDVAISGHISLTCATPDIKRTGAKEVTITCTSPAHGVTIHYTLDGTTPTTSSPSIASGGTIDLSGRTFPVTVKAMATAEGYESSTAEKQIADGLSGSGTAAAPYLIDTDYDFTVFVSMVNDNGGASSHYKLTSDLSASGSPAVTTPFTGTLDGDFHSISHLGHALVNTVDGGVVKNVMLKNVSINSSAESVGAIANEAKGYSRIYNCGILPNQADFPEGTGSHPTVSTTGSYAGSIVGTLQDDSRVVNCFSYADVGSGGTASGIVGNNTFASDASMTDGKYSKLRTMVTNCMYYGDITASTIYPVYGGTKISNSGANAINNYNYYSVGCHFSNTLADYYCSWPAQTDYLTLYEFHRHQLNSNRELCGWWVGAPSAPSTMEAADVQAVPKDASLMAKWVLDPATAPYPILKPFGRYASPVNIDADAQWRESANDWEGKKLGALRVIVKAGAHHSALDKELDIIITDMDTLRSDYCYRKIQLPYYNTVFGDPEASTWAEKYGDNYGEYVVTGWDISNTNGAEGTFTEDWQNGYNFADRTGSAKDKQRVFAQGGYYYVPNDVTSLTITAHWGKAVYIGNGGDYYDRVDFHHSNNKAGTAFAPAGIRSVTLGNGQTIHTDKIATVAENLPGEGTVYDNAIVLVGNHQYCTGGEDVAPSRSFTIMSADFDFDDEPDYCLDWQLGSGTGRQSICPIRFDFLPVVEIGLGLKKDGSTQYYSLGCYRPIGHYEVTETALIRFGQFEFSNVRTTDSPIILNGGIFEQYTKGTTGASNAQNDKITYIIIGGNVRIPSFTPGSHVGSTFSTRHCAVNVIGGRIDNLYLTGNYNDGVTPNTDNPHCYIDGGRLKHVAAAGKEGINGDVYFGINHAKIWEFYGGSTMADKLVKGSINVTIDNSMVDKYCGGPKFGDMDHANSKTVTTNATGTTFGVYYGGGNGGTSYVQYDRTDGDKTVSATFDWGGTGKLNNYTPGSYRTGNVNYMADYDLEIINVSTGTNDNSAVYRSYFYAAQFSATNTGSITNTLTDCTVLTNFYGGGNLGGVVGNVTSTLAGSTIIKGSAFGAGYSASVPEVTIYNKDKVAPAIDVKTGIITPQSGGTGTTYTWTNKTSINGTSLSTSSPIATDTDGKKYYFTEVSLENLGSVTGNVTLTIQGNTHVEGTVAEGDYMADSGTGSVYGGGDESAVMGNADVIVTDDAKVLGNVYGGGNIGSVGTSASGGKTTVSINGNAEIGPDGMKMTAAGGPDNAGMVFGAGRGTVDPLYDDPTYKNVVITDKGKQAVIAAMTDDDLNAKLATLETLAYVNETEVTIGGTAFVKGSVYGGSENGHVRRNTKVNIQDNCQIGNGDGVNRRYRDEEWSSNSLAECSHWVYGEEGDPSGGTHSPHDIFADEWTEALDPQHLYANGALVASDGHTLYGNVFGGGSGYYPYAPNKWLRSAGVVEGNTEVRITGGHILTSVYGGNEMTDVNGSCTVAMSGGTVGVPRSTSDIAEHPVTCSVFGAGKGDERTGFNLWTNVGSSSVTISGTARVFGSVFGGGEDGHVLGNAATAITAGSEVNGIRYPYIGSNGDSGYDGNVFGGGRGFAEVALTAGVVCGNVTLNITDGTVLGSVFGGGRLASVGTYLAPPDDSNYGKMQSGEKHGNINVTISGGTIGVRDSDGNLPTSLFTLGDVYAGCKGSSQNYVISKQLGQAKTTALIISQANPEVPTLINGSAFGGGEAGNVQGGVSVNMLGGTVASAVFGGGARANTNTSNWDDDKDNGAGKEKGGWADGKSSASATTTVNLLGGTVGSVYGGGLGLKEGIDEASEDLPAYVYGDVQVNLNGLAATEYVPTMHSDLVNGNKTDSPDYYIAKDGCVVKENVFGCNNLSGTPKGTATVHIYKTKGWDGHYRTGKDAETADDRETLLNDADDDNHTYEVAAVYGGGNLAAYEPADLATASTHVIIDGCELTSIRQVYGGGNAASAPATLVDINGTYEIEEAFGGGNGFDLLPNGKANPGANVGYSDYSDYENSDDADMGAATKELRMAHYQYGKGEAQMNILGGRVHRVFGGSNTKGNVRISAVTMLEEEGGCDFKVDEAYGGGKSAPMDAEAKLLMSCIPGLSQVYGGAKEADIQGDVNLKITNGKFDRVFGGNNISGTIRGSITVDVEEVGCQPIVIGELYGGGNEAPYSVYGYKQVTEQGKLVWKPREEADGLEMGMSAVFKDPVVNVKSFTSIGDIYGGGLGGSAVMIGNPTVNVNVTKGKWAEYIDNKIGVINNVFGGGNAAEVKGNTTVNIGTEAGKGADIRGNVFGGGNQAEVTGDSNVTIGQKTTDD